MTELMQYVDVLIANEEDSADVFGITADKTDITKGEIDRDGYVSVAKKLCDTFHFEKVAITLRTSISASDNESLFLLPAIIGRHFFITEKKQFFQRNIRCRSLTVWVAATASVQDLFTELPKI